MTDQQFVYITARVKDGTVVLSSRDPSLSQDSDQTWTFTIAKGTPPEVVFRLDIIDGGNGWTVRSVPRVGADTWGSWVAWSRDGVYVSPTFVHDAFFQLEIVRSKSSTSTARGGGFFQVRDAGGGGGIP